MEARKGSRGWWVFLAILAVFVFFGGGLVLVIYTASPSDGAALLTRDRIAVLPLRGVITDNHLVIRQLREYRRDSSVRGFVLCVDSPGGGVAPSQSIFRALRRVRAEGYPVVAAIGSVGASGAYYAALGADSILAMPGSLIGSIGVVIEFPNATELLEKVGLSFEVVKSSEHKDIGSPYRDATEADRALLQSVVDDVYGQFVEAVAEARSLPTDSVMKVADGRMMSGRSALDYGLIDGEGDLDDAVAMVGEMAGLGSEPRTLFREERRRAGWLELFSSALRATDYDGPAAVLRDALTDGWLREGPRIFYMFGSR